MLRSASGAVGAAAALLVSGCLFPEYTFDEVGPAGGGGGAAQTSTSPSSTSASTTSTGPTAGGGGQGGMAPTEDCYTAGDEDDDDLADCEDPDCAPDVECVDPTPVGWGTIGHVALYRGAAGSDPACPAGTTAGAYAGSASLTNTAAQCTSCGCMTPSWTSCEFVEDFNGGQSGLQALYVGNQTCGMFGAGATLLTVPSPWPVSTCSAIDTALGGQTCSGLPCNSFVDVGLARPAGGTCAPSGGQPANGLPTWQDAVKACEPAPTLGGCAAPQVCVPKPPAPYEPRICIGRAGDQTCPAPFTLKNVAYGDFVDNRDCTACTCGAGANGTCTLAVDLYTDASCMTAPFDTVSSNSCAALSGNLTIAGRVATVQTPPAGGSCPVTGGGAPTGAVTETDPTTFCCLP